MKKSIIIAVLLFCFFAQAEATDFITIDTVYSFIPGTGQSNGQDSAYFPANIFGTPGEHGDSIAPVSAQEDLLSLGLNGEITVGFKNFSVIDGDGNDFFIFENVMFNLLAKKYFVEPAKVAVSENGNDWYEFPFDSLTLEGCAGTHPTYADIHGDGFTDRGGDGFDIASSGFNAINYIKITDISSIIKNNKQHPFYDPIISGFDLDAVVAVHFKEKSSEVTDEIEPTSEKAMLYTDFLRTMAEQNGVFKVFDLNGNQTISGHFSDIESYFSACSAGVYFISLRNASTINFWKTVKP